MYIKNNRGQSTVEYILLVTAVVAVMIVFATNKNGILQTQLNSTLNSAASDIGTMGSALTESHQPGNSENAAGGPSNPVSLDVTNGLPSH